MAGQSVVRVVKQWLCGLWGHADGAPAYTSLGLMSHGWQEESYTCRRCGHVTTRRWMS